MRIPDRWLGGDVAVLAPLKAGAVAHRLTYYRPRIDSADLHPAALWRNTAGIQPKPRCIDSDTATAAGRYAEHSAAWADKHGAEACPRCYNEGDQ